MTTKEYEAKLKRIEQKNKQIEMRRELKAKKLSRFPKMKKPSTSKLVLLAVLLLNFQIVVFVERAMLQWGDFSAAYALIGIPATLIPIVWGYYSKSKAENTQGGIVYDMAMKGLNDTTSFDDNALG